MQADAGPPFNRWGGSAPGTGSGRIPPIDVEGGRPAPTSDSTGARRAPPTPQETP
jgi:hypothetical protein